MYGICHWLLVSRAAFQEKSRIGMATSSLRRVDRVNIKHKQNYFFFSWNQSTNGTIGYLGKIPKCYEIIILMLKFRVKIKFLKQFFCYLLSQNITQYSILPAMYMYPMFSITEKLFFLFQIIFTTAKRHLDVNRIMMNEYICTLEVLFFHLLFSIIKYWSMRTKNKQ